MENNVEELAEIYATLLAYEVVEGPPDLKAIVEEYWPELLHKVKPPHSEMH